MDFLFIFKYAAYAFGAALLVLGSYRLTKSISLSILGSGSMYDSPTMLIFEIVGASFLASGWLCAVESWNVVAVLFIVILIPALLGLWGAIELKRQKLKEAKMEIVRQEIQEKMQVLNLSGTKDFSHIKTKGDLAKLSSKEKGEYLTWKRLQAMSDPNNHDKSN